ncbi:presenilin-like protein At2g29900 [Amaranthus tricolor]|uniref:presenilin-like protein At2g29900 n=1 Tax=Amaranthus tricolor TaxID=29722 RepID=UPI00258C602F|nr:presenilin-like protein At2g29900 [Amaranthus tricolor]
MKQETFYNFIPNFQSPTSIPSAQTHPKSLNFFFLIKFLTMERIERPSSIIDTLGEELVRIITPVSICMLLVVLLVSTLSSSSSSSSDSNSIITIANLAYDESNSDSFWDKFEGALLNSFVFVVIVTLITFFLVFLFYIRCTKFLKFYVGFSAFMVLGFMGGQVLILLIAKLSLPIDPITYMVLLFNFAIVGVLAVFMSKMAIFITQAYLVVIGVLVAYWFTMLPEWTTWVLLVAMSLYDLGAVLLPIGPLRLLVELAIDRDEDIPALVYEARPVNVNELDGVSQRRLWRDRRGNGDQQECTNNGVNSVHLGTSSDNRTVSTIESSVAGRDLASVEEGRVPNSNQDASVPLLEQRMIVESRGNQVVVSDDNMAFEGIGLGASGAIKLGLGDFIFYSVLVGRAAMYDYMTVYACYLAIIAGLGITLMLLAVYQKALPALPVSVMLGVLFYVLTRALLEEFVMQCSMNFVMF